MGGEKFDTPQPEAYLFGENMDLNFFSKCPTTVSRFIYIKLSNSILFYTEKLVICYLHVYYSIILSP